jgi:dehydrogenase/reductase SDR family protein 12
MFGEQARRVWAFYNYGRKRFTQTGWRDAERLNTSTDMTGKVFVITGANSGLGKCLTTHLHAHGATVVMVCRNPGRAEAARAEIVSENNKQSADKLQVLIGDMSLKSGVEGVVSQLTAEHEVVDGLVCNAGTYELLHECAYVWVV